ncbi:MAG: efflux RND transporter permease subunit [Bacteroidales bacterium]|nr:efflux RND transporter permease subunit [Candidatus Latescibacterota bacterium]
MNNEGEGPEGQSFLNGIIYYFLSNKLVVAIAVIFIIAWGIMSAPFDWNSGRLPGNPVSVDAIPDIGENQQIVFTEWMGRSPQDIEDQITYPLTVSLLGIKGVRTVRSYSFFGFSTIYLIFEESEGFYDSRSRIIEKLNALPTGLLPEGASPALGPDATALGQVFWYTLEGYGEDGRPAGGWDLDELRSIQDWTVRYALMSAGGVSEVASIGGHVREYQVDVDPDALTAYGISLSEVFNAVRMSNIDVGAGNMEINKVEYIVRGIGFVNDASDIGESVIKDYENSPVRVKDVANVTLGPSMRRGALDKGGAEAVGGVVVVRYGENPLEVIKNVKSKIAEISRGLPRKVLSDGTVSQVRIVPFYDRSGLIYETLGTLNVALVDEILVTVIVVLFLLMHIRAALLIAGILPLTILLVFIAMKLFGVDANIVALSGIAIAIGTIVDMGIVVTENILGRLRSADAGESTLKTVYRATAEVAGAVLTAISTTVISFLPVFTMQGAEGKLFKPLAYTKTFALLASVVVALSIMPAVAHLLFKKKKRGFNRGRVAAAIFVAGIFLAAKSFFLAGVVLILIAAWTAFSYRLSQRHRDRVKRVVNPALMILVAVFLTMHWRPLGYASPLWKNFMFTFFLLGGWLMFFRFFRRYYEVILRWCLGHRKVFLSIPLFLVLFGGMIWLGFDSYTGFLPAGIRSSKPFVAMNHSFPGLGREFMPSLDEGSFLYMPTTMPHASIGEALDILHHQDKAFSSIPEVESVVGKIGRVDSPLDPAPISMIETVINYKSEFISGDDGRPLRFRFDRKSDEFLRDNDGKLIPDSGGQPYRNWREGIDSPDDIWREILKAGKITGTTSAPKLQPIETRLVMLQSGMRAPMGIKVKGPDLETIEGFGFQLELLLKRIPEVNPDAVVADRIVGKPYIEITIDREKAARYGLHIRDIQNVIETAVGGRRAGTTVEGRERYPIRVRYKRELRNTLEAIGSVLVDSPGGRSVPLSELSDMDFVRGPMVIKSEDTFLVGHVIFDGRKGMAEMEVIEAVKRVLDSRIEAGDLVVPDGVSYSFAGTWENQVRSEKKLAVVLPLALLLIFLILYFQFKDVSASILVFSGIFVAWAGGFIMLWLYGTSWFMDFSVFGIDMRQLFQIRQYHLSVAVWVGFLALFGIASDDGVVITTYLSQVFKSRRPSTPDEVREAVVLAGTRRIRPALMTSATTILALIPVLTSTGRGSDIMVPMAIPSFGGMTVVMITVFLVPVLYSYLAEGRLKKASIPRPEDD